MVIPDLGVFFIRVAAGKRCLHCWLLSNQRQTTSSPSSSATVMTGPPDFNLTVVPTTNVDISPRYTLWQMYVIKPF